MIPDSVLLKNPTEKSINFRHFFNKITFSTDFGNFLDKLRAPSENIDDFPSIDLYTGGLAKLKTCLPNRKISVLFVNIRNLVLCKDAIVPKQRSPKPI